MGCAAPNPLHWQKLRDTPQRALLSQAGVIAATDGVGVEVPFLNASYRVDLEAERIQELAPNPDRLLTESFQILLLNYLMAPPGGPLTGQEVSEKELPGGATFFQGPHRLPVDPIVEKFGCDPESFGRSGQALGGTSRELGDCAVRLLPFPVIPLTLILWRADDEFPATVSALFDRSILRWFELDMIFLMVQAVSLRLAAP